MADTVDSISIELTASTESAESSIDRLIGKLNQLKAAVSGASNFNRVAKGIASIAAVASGIDGDAGRKLNHLAAGLTALSRVGDLSNLKGAGKNLSSVVSAVSGMGQSGGKGLSGLADSIKQTSDALGGIKDSDVSRLGAVRDALSGEMSGSLHSSGVVNESAALGGMAPSAQGALPAATEITQAFGSIAERIRDATSAYREFQAALGGGVNWTGGNAGNNGTWYADDIQDPSGAWKNIIDSFPKALPGQVGEIETEFADVANRSEEAAGSVTHLRDALGSIGGYIANDVTTVFSNIGNAIKNFASSVLRIARYRMIRSMIRTITEGLSEGKKNLYEWSKAMNGHFAASMDRLATSTQYLKNSLGTLVGPLMEALEPALNWIIDALVTAINYFNMFIAAISGKSTYTAAVRTATTWGGAVSNAAGNASNAVNNAVDDMKRTIMGFDEINKLNDVADAASGGGGGGSGGGGGGGGGVGAMFEERELSGGFQQFSNALELALQDSLSRITLIVGAAELAVGAILALSGANIPLGLALIATGAVTMGSAIFANWEGIPDQIKLVVGAIEAALGTGLAVGAVLAFSSGHIGLGIGMMVAALSMEFSAVTVVWTTLKDNVGGQIQAISVLVSGATFGLGAVLAFAGHPGLGIAMMIAGGTVSAVSINWNFLMEKLEGPIGAVTALISGATLALGVIALVGGMIPLGIGLILAGAAGLATSIAANWDNIVEFGRQFVAKFIEPIADIGNKVWETITSGITSAYEYFQQSIEDAGGNVLLGILVGIGNAVLNIGKWIKDNIFTPFLNGLKTVFGIASPAKTMEEPGENIVLGIFQGIVNALANVGQWVKDNIFTPIWNAIKSAGETAISITVSLVKKVGEWASDVWDAIKTGAETIIKTISAVVGAVASFTGDVWDWIKRGSETVFKTMSAVAGAVANFTGTIWEWVRAGAETVIKTVSAVVGAVAQFTGDIWEWIRKGAETIFKTVSAVVGSVAQFAGTIWDWIIEGSKTIFKTVSAVAGAVSNFTGTIWDWVRAGAETIVKTVKAIFTEVGNWAGNVWNAVKNGAETIVKTVSAIFSEVGSWTGAVWNSVKTGTETILKTIEAGITKGANWLSDVWDFITGPANIFKTIFISTSTGDEWDGVDKTKNIYSEEYWKDKGVSVQVPITPTVTGDNSALQAQIDEMFGSLFATVKVGLEKTWKVAPLDWLGLSNLSATVSMSMEKTWKVAPLQWLGLNSLSATVSMSMEKTWKVTPLQWLGLNSLSATVSMSMSKSWKNTALEWLGLSNLKSTVSMSMSKTWSGSAKKWLGVDDLSDTVKMSMSKTWSGSAKKWLGLDGLSTKVKVSLQKGSPNKITVSKSGDTQWQLQVKKRGGIFANGIWRNIAQYAGGTTNAAHGSMFIAGEAGPELVGHVGGRTEVLNQSQLAATMYSAVRNAMSGVKIAATMYDGGSDNSEADYEMMYRAMYDAFSDAMAGSNERDREKVQLMRQIAAKEFTAEVTAASVNRAQTRMNRRAGTTIVPVGT